MIRWLVACFQWRLIATRYAWWTEKGQDTSLVTYHLFENGNGRRKVECFGIWPKRHHLYETAIYAWLHGGPLTTEGANPNDFSAGQRMNVETFSDAFRILRK